MGTEGLRIEAKQCRAVDFDDVYYYIRWRLELEGETENTGVCTKERKGGTAAVKFNTSKHFIFLFNLFLSEAMLARVSLWSGWECYAAPAHGIAA